MSQPVKVTKQFAADFELVAAFYKCTEAEILDIKAAARADIAEAEISFRSMAVEIGGGAK